MAMIPFVTLGTKSRNLIKILSRIPKPQGDVLSKNYSVCRPVKLAMNVFESSATNPNLAPIVIMHGLFGSKQNWRTVAKGLESKTKRKIYNVDARNHGESPHTREHNSGCLASDIVQLMQDQNLKKISCIGHSMGGRAMMYFAFNFPELIEKLIVVDISPINMPHNFEYMMEIFNAMKKVNVSSNLSLAQGRAIAEKQLRETIGGENGTVDFIMHNFKKLNTGEFGWALNVDALSANFPTFQTSSVKGRFDGPTLFIGGKHSDFLRPDEWPEIKEYFPNAELKWLDTGHLCHMEEPAEFMELVTDFLGT